MAVSAGLREPVTTFSPTDQVVGSRAPETHAATISILPLEMAYDPVARYIAAEGAESCTDGPQLTVSRGTPVLTARPRALPMSRFLAAEGGATAETPLPPGYDPDTWTTGPASRPSLDETHFYDPDGGEWHWHAPDKWHPEGHWDYKPPSPWNAPWQHIYQNPDGTWSPR